MQFPQITIGPGNEISGPILPNTLASYSCDLSEFFLNGPLTNQCDGQGQYEITTAPSCERGKLNFFDFVKIKQYWRMIKKGQNQWWTLKTHRAPHFFNRFFFAKNAATMYCYKTTTR